MAIMMGVGGFVLFEVQQNLAISNQLLNQGQNNIKDLDTRISETGTMCSRQRKISLIR